MSCSSGQIPLHGIEANTEVGDVGIKTGGGKAQEVRLVSSTGEGTTTIHEEKGEAHILYNKKSNPEIRGLLKIVERVSKKGYGWTLRDPCGGKDTLWEKVGKLISRQATRWFLDLQGVKLSHRPRGKSRGGPRRVEMARSFKVGVAQ